MHDSSQQREVRHLLERLQLERSAREELEAEHAALMDDNDVVLQTVAQLRAVQDQLLTEREQLREQLEACEASRAKSEAEKRDGARDLAALEIELELERERASKQRLALEAAEDQAPFHESERRRMQAEAALRVEQELHSQTRAMLEAARKAERGARADPSDGVTARGGSVGGSVGGSLVGEHRQRQRREQLARALEAALEEVERTRAQGERQAQTLQVRPPWLSGAMLGLNVPCPAKG